MKALQAVYPDYVDVNGEFMLDKNSFNYPRPLSAPPSAPPSPRSSRKLPANINYFRSLPTHSFCITQLGHNTPSQSLHGSDDEQDSVDEELELHELNLNEKKN